MAQQILTEVRGRVDSDREVELVAGFREIAAGGVPEGIVRTELLRGQAGLWRIQTLWRDRAALDSMRDRPEPPAAVRLFHGVGAEPALEVLEVEHRHMIAAE